MNKDFKVLPPNSEVDDIDEEVYYREMTGCSAEMETGGNCAVIKCGENKSHICQKPGVSRLTNQVSDLRSYPYDC